MNKRKLHHYYKFILLVRPLYILLACGFFFFVGILAMRANSFEAIKLRDNVVKVDEQNGDVETALRELRSHIYSHMNSDLSGGSLTIRQPVQLKARYERLAKAEADRVKKINAQAQKTAEGICRRKFPQAGFNSPRVSCIADYVKVHATTEKQISSELYKFDFYSPRWTPDIAGISVVLGFVFGFLLLTRLAVGWWFRHEL